MMTPPDCEIGLSRKWRWFKKSETEVKKSKNMEHSSEQGEEEEVVLKGNTFKEELFEDPLEEESTSENVEYRDTSQHEEAALERACSKDTRSLCESLVNDLLFKIMESKDFNARGTESGQSKSLNLLRSVEDQLTRQDADNHMEGFLVGKLGCQGCGTEQVCKSKSCLSSYIIFF